MEGSQSDWSVQRWEIFKVREWWGQATQALMSHGKDFRSGDVKKLINFRLSSSQKYQECFVSVD